MNLVPPEGLANAWPKVEAWISEAIDQNQGDENLLDVLIAIARGHYGLWMDAHFACVTQLVTYPQQRVLTLLYIGGELDHILAMFDWAKEWCKQNKVDVLRTYGRPGWERVTGLSKVGVILQTEITL